MKNLKLSTKRLLIRPYVNTDFESWRDGYRGRLPKKNKFDAGQVTEERITKLRFRKNLKFHEKARKKDRLYVFGVFDRKDRRHIGFLDIYILSRLDFQYANLGYAIHNQYWGNGYAQEAVGAVLKIAFEKLKLHRIEAGIERDNKASIAVAKGVGMKSEGVRKRIVYEDGEWRDLITYVMTAEDLGIKKVKPSIYVDFGEILRL